MTGSLRKPSQQPAQASGLSQFAQTVTQASRPARLRAYAERFSPGPLARADARRVGRGSSSPNRGNVHFRR